MSKIQKNIIKHFCEELVYIFKKNISALYLMTKNVEFDRFGLLLQNVRIYNKGKIQIKKRFTTRGFGFKPIVIFVNNENSELLIGENVFLNAGVEIAVSKKIVIGNNVKIGDDARILDDSYHEHFDVKRKIEEVHIGSNVWIGPRSVIMPGVKIGDGALVAACSVVTKNVSDFSMVAGVPAKFVRSIKAAKI